MKANRVSAREGARWLVEGLRVLRKAPLQIMLMHLALLFAVVFFLSIPSAGFALFWLLAPALFVGPHAAMRAAAGAGELEFSQIFAGFRTETAALLRLGAIFLVVLVAALGVTALADDGRLFRAMTGIEKLKMDDLFEAELHNALLLWAILETGIFSILWYSPLLVAWHGVPPLKSVFFSAAAIVLNWRAMLAFGAVMVLALFVLSLGSLAVASLAGAIVPSLRSEGARISAGAFAATWTFLPVLFAASWRSYQAIFGTAAPARDTGSEAD